MKIQTCEHPICPIHSNTKYCIRRTVGAVIPEPVKKYKKLQPRSEKRIKEQLIYVAKVKAAAKEDDSCEVKSPVCTGKMQGFNHIQKRSPKNWLDSKNLEKCCNMCNSFIENNTEWAKEHGHFISKYKK